jgi:hypothetical protein
MKPLLDLEPNDCRWPVTHDRPHLFCGEPKLSGGGYCACHKAMSVAAEQPEPWTERRLRGMADVFAGGRCKDISKAHVTGRRRPVDIHLQINRSWRAAE